MSEFNLKRWTQTDEVLQWHCLRQWEEIPRSLFIYFP